MEAFVQHTGLVVPIDRSNVDTDAIIPVGFLASIKRTGFGPHMFDEWRYLDIGKPGQDPATRQPNPDFVLNQPRYQGATILLARENYGCGSSREHAAWATLDYGFRALIAPSFADIHYNNLCKNGILPVILTADEVDSLFKEVFAAEGYQLTVDLQTKTVTKPDGSSFDFDLSDSIRERLLGGLDDIGVALESVDQITAFEAKRREAAPWLFQT